MNTLGRCYIAGPMRGVKYYNYPAFDAKQRELHQQGFTVMNPAEMDRLEGFDPYTLPEDHDWNTLPEGLPLDDIINRDIEAVRSCTHLALLSGWENSTGAKAEKAMAEWCGLTIMYPEGRFPGNREAYPVASGVLDYFPDALIAVAQVSKAGNEQHNPGQPLHWDRSKSTDHDNKIIRHFMERGTVDSDGTRHSAKLAWRALARLQEEIERAK